MATLQVKTGEEFCKLLRQALSSLAAGPFEAQPLVRSMYMLVATRPVRGDLVFMSLLLINSWQFLVVAESDLRRCGFFFHVLLLLLFPGRSAGGLYQVMSTFGWDVVENSSVVAAGVTAVLNTAGEPWLLCTVLRCRERRMADSSGPGMAGSGSSPL
jgi:hypothetical protein